MAYTLGSKCAKNLCKRLVVLQLIIENVVTCYSEHSVGYVHTYGALRWDSRDSVVAALRCAAPAIM